MLNNVTSRAAPIARRAILDKLSQTATTRTAAHITPMTLRTPITATRAMRQAQQQQQYYTTMSRQQQHTTFQQQSQQNMTSVHSNVQVLHSHVTPQQTTTTVMINKRYYTIATQNHAPATAKTTTKATTKATQQATPMTSTRAIHHITRRRMNTQTNPTATTTGSTTPHLAENPASVAQGAQTTTPPITQPITLQSLDVEQQELAKKAKVKKPWWKTALKLTGFIIGGLIGGTLFAVNWPSIRLSLIRASTSIKVYVGDLDYIYKLANPQYLNQGIKFIESGDFLTDFVSAQQVWYHDSYVLQHYIGQCDAICAKINTQFFVSAADIQKRYDELLQGKDATQTSPKTQAELLKLQQLYTELEDIVNHVAMTQQDLQMFLYMLETSNNLFAASPFHPPISNNHEEANTRYKEISESIQAAQLYLSQLLELLSITTTNLTRTYRLGEFINNLEGFDEYRAKCQQEDVLKQQQYDESMEKLQRELIALKYPNDPEKQEEELAKAKLQPIDRTNNSNMDPRYNQSPIPTPSQDRQKKDNKNDV